MYGVNGGLQKYSKRIFLVLSIILILSLIGMSLIPSHACIIKQIRIKWREFYDIVWNNAVRIGKIVYNNTTLNIYYYNMSRPLFVLESGANCTIRITVFNNKPYNDTRKIIEKYFGWNKNVVYTIWDLGGILFPNRRYLPYMEIIFTKTLRIPLKYLDLEVGPHLRLPGGFLELIEEKNNTVLVMDSLLSIAIDQKTNNTIEYVKVRIILSNINGLLGQSVYSEYYMRVSKNITAKTFSSYHVYLDKRDKLLVILENKPIVTKRSFNPRSLIIIYSTNIIISERKIISFISSVLNKNPFAEASGNYSVEFNITEPLIIYNGSSLQVVGNVYGILGEIYNRFVEYYNNYSSILYNKPIKLVLIPHPMNKGIADINIRQLSILENKTNQICEKIEHSREWENPYSGYYVFVSILLTITLILIALFPIIAWRKVSRAI